MKKFFFFLIVLLFCSSCLKPLDTATITVEANYLSMGVVTGGGAYFIGDTAKLYAEPNDGYYFSEWIPGGNENPLPVVVEKDATFTAIFQRINSNTTEGSSVTWGNGKWSNVNQSRSYLYNGTLICNLLENNSSNFPQVEFYIPNVSNTGIRQISIVNAKNDGHLPDGYYLEYYENSTMYSVNNTGDTIFYGDWWGKSANIIINSFNNDTRTVNLTIDATMYYAYDHFINGVSINNCATRKLKIDLPNITYTEMTKLASALNNCLKSNATVTDNIRPYDKMYVPIQF